VCIDARVVGIAPEEPDSVVANGQRVHRFDVRGLGLRVQTGGSGPLVDTMRAGATHAQKMWRVYAPVSIFPVDNYITCVELYRVGLESIGQRVVLSYSLLISSGGNGTKSLYNTSGSSVNGSSHNASAFSDSIAGIPKRT